MIDIAILKFVYLFYLVPLEVLLEALSRAWGLLLSDRRIKVKVQFDAISTLIGIHYENFNDIIQVPPWSLITSNPKFHFVHFQAFITTDYIYFPSLLIFSCINSKYKRLFVSANSHAFIYPQHILCNFMQISVLTLSFHSCLNN